MSTEELGRLARRSGLLAGQAWALPDGGGALTLHRLEIDPYEFLLCAEADLELGDDAAELNALTNAKRAIESQIDQVLLTFGVPVRKLNIPRKLEALRSFGVVVPRILRRVSAARNVLEHEYRRPSHQEIEDALDLAALFLAAVRPAVEHFEDEFRVGNVVEGEFEPKLQFSMCVSGVSNTFIARGVDSPNQGSSVLIGPKDGEMFAVLVALAIAAARDFRIEPTIERFCALVLDGNP